MTGASHFFGRELREIVDDSLPDMDKVKKLFKYVRDNFTVRGNDVLSEDSRSIKEIFKSKKGNVGEINLLLTAMLRDEGLKADAVILSTRGNGVINPYYPLLWNLNYVVVRLRMGGQDYFLDATDRRMGFGKIPPDCYNGYARVVYVFRMDIPKGYEVEELPKGAKVTLNGADGSYEYGFLSDGQTLQFRSRPVLKRTYFLPEDYLNLRDFFALVVKKQGEVVVFKKKK